jgi:hypothetical protein
MRWYFMIYEAISLTTVESLNTLATQYIKKWLGTSPKATPEFLTSSERGLRITPLSDVYPGVPLSLCDPNSTLYSMNI